MYIDVKWYIDLIFYVNIYVMRQKMGCYLHLLLESSTLAWNTLTNNRLCINNLRYAQGEAQVVLDKQNNILKFINICVGTKSSLDLHLYNYGLVPCEVSASVKEPHFGFLVQPNKLIVPPHSHAKINVSFNPTQIGVCPSLFRLCHITRV